MGQTNEGSKYVPQVLKKIGLEAGEHCAKRCQDVDRKREQDKARKSSLQFKKKGQTEHAKSHRVQQERRIKRAQRTQQELD